MTLPTTNLTVLPDWIDHNGHMNVAFYVLAFDLVTDAVYEQWGIGAAREKQQLSVFTLGMNVDYRSELFEGDAIRVTTQLLDCDHKRIHYFHQMYHAESGVLAATNECLCTNVDMTVRKSVPFSAELQQSFTSVLNDHQKHGVPQGAFRALKIRRKDTQ